MKNMFLLNILSDEWACWAVQLSFVLCLSAFPEDSAHWLESVIFIYIEMIKQKKLCVHSYWTAGQKVTLASLTFCSFKPSYCCNWYKIHCNIFYLSSSNVSLLIQKQSSELRWSYLLNPHVSNQQSQTIFFFIQPC